METTVEVRESSQVAEVRRVASDMARAEHLTEPEAGRLALIATEVSTNLVKYAARGSVTVSRYAEAGRRGVELVAVDHGPGLADISASMRDGHSTAGSLGIGLGGIKRAASYFDVYSVLGQGTAVLARVERGSTRRKLAEPGFLLSARSTPKRGQIENGDAWRCRELPGRQLICIVDGLGHGPLAALAARRAMAAFEAASPALGAGDMLQLAHAQLKDTRGVVMAVLALDSVAGTAEFSGVGNISAVIVHESKNHHLLSIEGIAGYNLRKVRVQPAPWLPGALAILHTDGVSSRWNLGKYPGLAARHPSLIASVLCRDFARDTDDATMVVAKAH